MQTAVEVCEDSIVKWNQRDDSNVNWIHTSAMFNRNNVVTREENKMAEQRNKMSLSYLETHKLIQMKTTANCLYFNYLMIFLRKSRTF